MSGNISVGRPTIRALGKNLSQSYGRDDLAMGFQFRLLAAILLLNHVAPVGIELIGFPLTAALVRFALLGLMGVLAVKLMLGLTAIARDSRDESDER